MTVKICSTRMKIRDIITGVLLFIVSADRKSKKGMPWQYHITDCGNYSLIRI